MTDKKLNTGAPGSSPRVRGRPAGPSAPRRARAVHPRACGGGLDARVQRPGRRRFIPARAGAAMAAAASARPVCGSSPRVGGRQPSTLRQGSCRRFIPARAGAALAVDQRLWAPFRFIPARAGAANGAVLTVGYSGGSSPRVRGRPVPSSRRYEGIAVHPRACGGGATAAAWWATSLRFIPARAGAAPRRDRTRRPPQRFIPARAGAAVTTPTVAGQYTVHPRACGGGVPERAVRRRARAVHPRACGGGWSCP